MLRVFESDDYLAANHVFILNPVHIDQGGAMNTQESRGIETTF